ncbi:sugar phosphate isomerase/epimerase family protein [Tabrizicola sp.]|uniref:sugar phosphate isomerase/epimerase family protein n=1 Tax=Tabrizicola sp. TaxID=2005166 RepID=UPI00286B1D4D|nr:sugar phosphate isomerase/epimerase family protein [Tabrizicola sp.]
MKIGFNLLLWTTHLDTSLLPTLRALKAAGYDGVEVPIFTGDPAYYRQMRSMLDGEGLMSTVVAIVQDEARNPLSAAHESAGIDYLKGLVDCAVALGAEVIGGPFYQPLGVFSGLPLSDEEWQRLVRTQTAMADHASSALTLAVEPLNRFECYALNTCDRAAKLVQAVNRPNYGYLFDTFHSNIEEKDPIAALQATMRHVRHIHISENDRGTPGRGHAPILPAITAAKAAGYNGWLTVEAFGHALPDIAAATRVWRPLFTSETEVYTEAIALIRRGLAA